MIVPHGTMVPDAIYYDPFCKMSLAILTLYSVWVYELGCFCVATPLPSREIVLMTNEKMMYVSSIYIYKALFNKDLRFSDQILDTSKSMDADGEGGAPAKTSNSAKPYEVKSYNRVWHFAKLGNLNTIIVSLIEIGA